MADADPVDACNGDPVDLTNKGLRIGAIFIIFAASLIGAISPIFLARQNKVAIPKLAFFVCKFIGTGVIIATAFMHLLVPAVENLTDECLADRLGEYDWAEAIALMTVIVMFFIEMLAIRFSNAGMEHEHGTTINTDLDPAMEILALKKQKESTGNEQLSQTTDVEHGYAPGGETHLAHGREHKEGDTYGGLTGQLLSIFILEFGVVFHSIFIGLVLATTDELVILLIVLVFHQMFEGLGLGSRLAVAPWPRNKAWLPYLLGFIFAISTPVGIAAGLGAKPNNRNTQKLVNGIFDAISAGILLYTGLVELLAHEFMFNPYMRRAPLKILLLAFACIAFGVAVMGLLAKWA